MKQLDTNMGKLWWIGCALRIRFLAIGLSICVSLGTGCENPTTEEISWQQFETPAPSGGLYPNLLSTPDGLVLSWLEQTDTVSSLNLGQFREGQWSSTEDIATGSHWFVNWADFPSVHLSPTGQMTAHYLAKNGTGTYAYGVQLTSKSDQGWTPPVSAHQNQSETEHGFASFFDISADQSAVVWLDGQAYAKQEDGPMSLRAATLSFEGEPESEMLLDERVCDCCQTDAVRTPSGAVVVYRDRSEDEIRDIYRTVFRAGKWSAPAPVHSDNWKISGCPVNGPAVASSGEQVVVAWFTGANEEKKVQLAFSLDEGEHFQEPIRIDLGNPEGRVDVVLVEKDQAWVSWIELAEGKGQVMAREVDMDGTTFPPQIVSGIDKSRASGFPVLQDWQDALWLAWTGVDSSGGSEIILMKHSNH